MPSSGRFRLSLRTRFVGSVLLVAILLSGGFYYAVDQFIEVLEAELLDKTVRQELAELVAYYQQSPEYARPSGDGIFIYVVRPGEPDTQLPEPLRSLQPENFRSLHWNNTEYYVGRRDLDGTRLYIALDIVGVEDLEARLVTFAWLFISVGLVVAVLVGLLLSRLVTQPVSRMAALVADLSPARRGVKLRDHFGDPEIGVIAAAFDRYLEQLDEFVAREQAFTEDASHELRTPLAIIISAAQLLQEDPNLRGLGQQRLQRLFRAAGRMQQLLEALLYLAREDGGLADNECDLRDMLEEVAENHREMIADKGLSLQLELGESQQVRAPAGMVLCVLNNLVGNAIQHTERGVIDLRLRDGSIQVQDSGQGIPAEELARIFERRYRGPQSRGMGLGLYIVKRICARLGWQVEAHSAPGAGARFVLRFNNR